MAQAKGKLKRDGQSFGMFSREVVPRIDAFMGDFLNAKISAAPRPFMREMYTLLHEYLMRDAKRIRPLVLCASYRGYSGAGEIPDGVIKLASVVEMMHSFLLIQDDIIDRSPVRRGGKALHVAAGEKYGHETRNDLIGNDIALVLADVLFANCVEIIANVKLPSPVKDQFLSIFARTYEMTAWGQILDSLHSMVRELRRGSNAPVEISTMKTAYYTLYYPVVMGHILSGRRDKKEWKRIEDFSLPGGLAFQMRDDVLGVFGKSETTGKPSDSDIHEQKLTILIQETVDRLPPDKAGNFIKIFTRTKKSDRDVSRIRSMIVESGAVEAVEKHLGELMDRSARALRELSIGEEGRHLLADILILLVTREK